MVGTGSRLFFALAAIGLLGAVAFGLASGGDPVGVVSLGYKGGVGEHFSYALLTAFGVTALGGAAFDGHDHQPPDEFWAAYTAATTSEGQDYINSVNKMAQLAKEPR